MKLYRVQLRLSSPLITALKGDTIWGHIAWGIANHEGEDAIKDFLKQCKGPNPLILVSSAFPHNMLCRPIPSVKKRAKDMTPDKYAEIKKDKKMVYVNANSYFSGIEDVSAWKEIQKPLDSVLLTHNTINRFSNTVSDGGLFATSEQWAENDLFDIYVLTDFSSGRVEQLLSWAFENGFGADSSTGKGYITISGVPEEVKTKLTSDIYMALAPFVLNPDARVSELRADIFIRNGKIGGSFSASMVPWKKPVVLFNEGAVFKSDEPIQYIGELLAGIHSDPRICQCAFAPVIPIE